MTMNIAPTEREIWENRVFFHKYREISEYVTRCQYVKDLFDEYDAKCLSDEIAELRETNKLLNRRLLKIEKVLMDMYFKPEAITPKKKVKSKRNENGK